MDSKIIYAIGDIHGRADLLRRMISRILVDAKSLNVDRPTVVMVGDYVDRGPDSKGVLDLLTSMELQSQINAIYLLGNHDDAMLGVLNTGLTSRADTWCQVFGGFETMESYGVDTRNQSFRSAIDQFCSLVPKAHRDFLDGLRLTFETDDIFFSHAGVDPGLPLEKQPEPVLLYGTKDLFKPLLWTAGIQKLCVHGHWSRPEIEITDNRVGIDTGCGFAEGHLSAVRLNGRIVEKRFPEAVTWEDI